jgi:hypothetical protein
MAKTYLPAGGGLTFKSVLRFVGPSPLDGRGVVDSLSDISGQAYKTTFGGSEFEGVDSFYEGMLVVTKDTGKLYVLNGDTFKEVTPDLSGIQSTLDAIPNTYVPKTLTINGKALNGNITLSASDIGLGNVTNLAAKDYFTALTSNTTNAIQITVGGITKEIKVDTLKASLGLGKLAYKDSLSYSDVGALSATGTAVEAESLTEAPSIKVGQDDSNTITITAGTKTSQPFTVPYSREAKKLSGGRVILKFYYQSSDTPIY